MSTRNTSDNPRRDAGGTQRRPQAGRRLTVRSDQRETPDVRKIALAILTLAAAKNESSSISQKDDADV